MLKLKNVYVETANLLECVFTLLRWKSSSFQINTLCPSHIPNIFSFSFLILVVFDLVHVVMVPLRRVPKYPLDSTIRLEPSCNPL